MIDNVLNNAKLIYFTENFSIFSIEKTVKFKKNSIFSISARLLSLYNFP